MGCAAGLGLRSMMSMTALATSSEPSPPFVKGSVRAAETPS